MQAIALPAGGSAGGRLPHARRPRRVCAPILLCLRIVEPAQPLDGDISAVVVGAERIRDADGGVRVRALCRAARELVVQGVDVVGERLTVGRGDDGGAADVPGADGVQDGGSD